MVKHIVFLSFKTDLTESSIKKIFQALGDLQQHIPEILSYSWGKNNSPEGLSQGFTHAFSMDFADEQARDTYLHHPQHQHIAKEMLIPALSKGLDSVIVVDYDYLPAC